MDEYTFFRDFPFYFALFKVTEGFWNAAGSATWDASLGGAKTLFNRAFKKDENSKRAAAFALAVQSALRDTQPQNISLAIVEEILNALNSSDPAMSDALAQESAKLMLYSATPDVNRLGVIVQQHWQWDQQRHASLQRPNLHTVTIVLAEFLCHLRNALLDHQPYQDLIQNEVLLALRQIVAELRPTHYDDENQYRSLLAGEHRQLNFVGIPEQKEHRPITLEDVFINLQTERRQHEDRWGSDWRYHAARLGDENVDEHEWRRMINEARMVVKEKVTIDVALRRAKKLMILGDPGAGKSTLLKYLTVICAENRSRKELQLATADERSPLPIFVTLRGFAAEQASRTDDYTLVDYFTTYAKERLMLNLPPDFFERALQAGRCLVCLDGLDEVWQLGARVAVRDAVTNLSRRHPDNRYLVSSRIIGYGEAPLNEQEFEHHTVLPLELPAIKSFVGNWYKARVRNLVERQHATSDLIKTLEEQPRIQTLAANPLLLTIIALVHRVEAELPHERVQLYSKCVETLVNSWETIKGLTLEEKQRPFYNKRLRLLEQLAGEVHRRAGQQAKDRQKAHTQHRQASQDEPQTIKIGDLERLITSFLMKDKRLDFADDADGARDEAQAFIRLVRSRTGLLVERGNGIFTFAHLTFQEYLAARDIEHRCYAQGAEALWQAIAPHLHDAHWREVILLLLGRLNQSDELPTLLVERMLEAGKGDPFESLTHRHLHLAARVLADRVEIGSRLRRQIINDLLAIANNPHEFGGRTAVHRLGQLDGNTQVVDGLLSLVKSNQVTFAVFHAAAQELGFLGYREQAAALFLKLAQDNEERVSFRLISATTLGNFGCEEQAATLILSIVQNDQIEDFERISAAFTFSNLGQEKQAAIALLTLAQNNKLDNLARFTAAKSIGELGYQDEFILNGLLELTRNDKVDEQIRISAAMALGALGCQDEFVLHGLLALVQDDKLSNGERGMAAQALGSIGCQDEFVLHGILALAQDDKVSDSTRGIAAQALGSIGCQDEFVLHGILALAQDDKVSDSTRSMAAQTLGALGCQEQAVPILLALTHNDKAHNWVRYEVAKALGTLGREDQAATMLLALAQNDKVNNSLRCSAAEALGFLGHQEQAATLLLALAQDDKVDDWKRIDNTLMLGYKVYSGRYEQVATLILALAQNDKVSDGIRSVAVMALGDLGRQDAFILQGLLTLAQDEKVADEVRRAAYKALIALLGTDRES